MTRAGNSRLERFRAITRNVRTGTSVALWVCLCSSVGLFCASFIVPPTGVIDPSVLKAGGEILGVATLFMVREAVLEGLGVKLTHGNTTVEIYDTDGTRVQVNKKNGNNKEEEYGESDG